MDLTLPNVSNSSISCCPDLLLLARVFPTVEYTKRQIQESIYRFLRQGISYVPLAPHGFYNRDDVGQEAAVLWLRVPELLTSATYPVPIKLFSSFAYFPETCLSSSVTEKALSYLQLQRMSHDFKPGKYVSCLASHRSNATVTVQGTEHSKCNHPVFKSLSFSQPASWIPVSKNTKT